MPGGTNLPNCDLARTLAEPFIEHSFKFKAAAIE